MRAGHVWRRRHIAPAHKGPRNESNNKAHEPTSGRSTRYGSGHLIRAKPLRSLVLPLFCHVPVAYIGGGMIAIWSSATGDIAVSVRKRIWTSGGERREAWVVDYTST